MVYEGTDGANRAWQRFVRFVTFDLPNHWNDANALISVAGGIPASSIVVSPPSAPPVVPVLPPFVPPVVAPPVTDPTTYPVARMSPAGFSQADLDTSNRLIVAIRSAWDGGVGVGGEPPLLTGASNVVGYAAEASGGDLMLLNGQVTVWPPFTGRTHQPGAKLVVIS